MWRVARSLEILREEINAAAPRRSIVSDGSIGDAAHATRSSDHNPWVVYGGQGIVRARDFTHDPAGGLDCNVLAERLAALIAVGGHPACRSGAYIIWRSRIFSFDRRGEGWRGYYGSNPHDKHLHLSVATDPAGFDSTTPWFVMTEKEDPMAEYDELLNTIRDDARAARRQSEKNGRLTYNRDQRILKGLGSLADAVDALADQTGDAATKRQVRQVRSDIADLADQLEAPEAGDDGARG